MPVLPRAQRGRDRADARAQARHGQVAHLARARATASRRWSGEPRARASRAPDRVPGRARPRAARAAHGSSVPSRRWWLVPALAALAVAGALLAIPQTRAAILDLFRIGGVEVRRVETQPRAPVARARARPRGLARDRAAQCRLPAPRAARRRSRRTSTGRMVNLRWKRYVLSQWHGEQLRSPRSRSARTRRRVGVEVRGATGLWITGARHEIIYRDPATERIVGEVAPARGQRPDLGGRRRHLPARGRRRRSPRRSGRRPEPQSPLAVYEGQRNERRALDARISPRRLRGAPARRAGGGGWLGDGRASVRPTAGSAPGTPGTPR